MLQMTRDSYGPEGAVETLTVYLEADEVLWEDHFGVELGRDCLFTHETVCPVTERLEIGGGRDGQIVTVCPEHGRDVRVERLCGPGGLGLPDLEV